MTETEKKTIQKIKETAQQKTKRRREAFLERFSIDPMSSSFVQINKDIRKAAKMMGASEVRFLVDLYYQIQETRKAAGNQVDRSEESDEPVHLLSWFYLNSYNMEERIKGVLDAFTKEYEVGQWLRGINGIGPVIAAGLMSTFDIRDRLIRKCDCKNKHQDKKHGKGMRTFKPIYGTFGDEVRGFQCSTVAKAKRCENIVEIRPGDITMEDGLLRRPSTAGAWWRFAGLDPTMKWNKGEIRPWNARAKVLCWKMASSFFRAKGSDKDFYGGLIEQRKIYEHKKNLAGDYSEQAEAGAERVSKNTVSYKSYVEGKLPDGHIQQRAFRWVEKLFLSHFHTVCYREYYGEEPPVPYVLSEKYKDSWRHTHFIDIPDVKIKGGKSLAEFWDK